MFGQKLYVCQHKISLFVLFRVRKKNKMEDDLTVCFDAVFSRFVYTDSFRQWISYFSHCKSFQREYSMKTRFQADDLCRVIFSWRIFCDRRALIGLLALFHFFILVQNRERGSSYKKSSCFGDLDYPLSLTTSSHNQFYLWTHEQTSNTRSRTEKGADACIGNKSWSSELWL